MRRRSPQKPRGFHRISNADLLEYLYATKNPLDKKFRWEVNTAFKQNRILDEHRQDLLKIKDRDLGDLIKVILHKVPIDKNQIGNYYHKRAVYLSKQRSKFQSTPLLFSK